MIGINRHSKLVLIWVLADIFNVKYYRDLTKLTLIGNISGLESDRFLDNTSKKNFFFKKIFFTLSPHDGWLLVGVLWYQ